MGTDPNEFRNHQLPLARIKKVKACTLKGGQHLELAVQTRPRASRRS